MSLIEMYVDLVLSLSSRADIAVVPTGDKPLSF